MQYSLFYGEEKGHSGSAKNIKYIAALKQEEYSRQLEEVRGDEEVSEEGRRKQNEKKQVEKKYEEAKQEVA